MTNTGIPVNAGMEFDAVKYKGENSNRIYDDSYKDGSAVQSTAPGMVLLDTKDLPQATLVGDVAVRIVWDSNSTTDYDLKYEVIKDGAEVIHFYFRHDDDETDQGSVVVHKFDRKSSYRIKITSVSSNTVTLDFIRFEQIFPGSLINATRRVVDGEETLPVTDYGAGNMTGDGDSIAMGYVSFNIEYSEPPLVYCQSGHHLIHASPTGITETGFTMVMAHINDVGWSSAQPASWQAIGNQKVPFAPTLPI